MKVRLTLLMFLFSFLYLNGQIKLGKMVNFAENGIYLGGGAENAVFGGSPVIMFRKNNINGTDGIVPLMKNRNEDYLPEEFTI